MLFNSATFLVFIIVVFFLYWRISKVSDISSRIILLISSYIFYGWWDWRFLILIFISSATDFLIGKHLYKTKQLNTRKLLLYLSIVINIGILGFFKYFNFFIESFVNLVENFGLHPGLNTLNIILPVGISFYTFQTLSYTIDIYKGKLKPTNSVLTFFTFVAFFPQLVAGPIERAANLIPQFEAKPVFSSGQATSGLKMILWGLFKKMVIADQVAGLVTAVFSTPADYNGFEILIAALFFGIQIYCDFSGYSDIAIGVAKLFGIELMINFRTPYFANSLRNFWQRWHISLSTWFRDYVYIPLGGNRGSKAKWAGNIMATFILSGLWHGANLTFLVWGFAHGSMLVAERFLSPLIKINRHIKSTFGWIFTFIIVNLCWIFFRAGSIQQAIFMFGKISAGNFGLNGKLITMFYAGNSINELTLVLFIAIPFFVFTEIITGKRTFAEAITKFPRTVRWGYYYLIIFMILFLGVLNSAPQFIYFQF